MNEAAGQEVKEAIDLGRLQHGGRGYCQETDAAGEKSYCLIEEEKSEAVRTPGRTK